MKKVTPFLMFQNNDAEEAINLYTSLIENSKIISINRYSKDEPGKEGSIKTAVFSLNGQEIMCSDSFIKHAFTFTPSSSIFLTCTTEDELVYLYENLSKDGEVLMPIDNYGFSKMFAWVNDRFGVSWQINFS